MAPVSNPSLVLTSGRESVSHILRPGVLFRLTADAGVILEDASAINDVGQVGACPGHTSFAFPRLRRSRIQRHGDVALPTGDVAVLACGDDPGSLAFGALSLVARCL
jgi:hypothetical protein